MKLIECHMSEDLCAHKADIVLRVTVGPGECSLLKDTLATAIREQPTLFIHQMHVPNYDDCKTPKEIAHRIDSWIKAQNSPATITKEYRPTSTEMPQAFSRVQTESCAICSENGEQIGTRHSITNIADKPNPFYPKGQG